MRVTSLMEVLDAAHLTRFVHSPFCRRGGILLIGPPGVMKSSLIDYVFSEYHDAKALSDINVQQLMVIRDDIAAGRFHTLGFYDLGKLYKRHSSTAANIEGVLQAMAEEGFKSASFEDPRRPAITANCLIVAGLTDKLHRQKYTEWDASGFSRRFLHCMYRLADHSVLMDAVQKWVPLDFEIIKRKWPTTKRIAYSIDEKDARFIRVTLKHQPGETTPYQLALRIFAVLTWKYDRHRAKEIWHDFSESLGSQGAELVLDQSTPETKARTNHGGK